MRRTVCALALLGVSAHALASDPAEGFYIGASIGNATLELEDADSAADFKGDDVGVKFIAGYRFLPWIGVEGGYIDYGTADDEVFGAPLESDFDAFYVSAIGMLPLGNFDLFARGGLSRWEGRLRSPQFGVAPKEDNVDPLFGLGAQYRAGRFAVRIEIEALLLSFDDDGDDESDGDDWIDFASAGFSWAF